MNHKLVIHPTDPKAAQMPIPTGEVEAWASREVVTVDRRTRESKLIRKSGLGMREAHAEQAIAEYKRADRCRICGVGVSDRMNAETVRITIDEALMSGATYKAALAAVEPFVAEWPPEERPTYAAIRNHAKRHLNSDEALIRALMEAHAIGAGVDVEDGAGSIVTPGGIFALIAQKGYEQLRDGDAVPTVGETIQASRALTAMEVDQLRDELKRERLMVRSLVTLVKEVAPGALESVTSSVPELSGAVDDTVVVIPDAGAVDPPNSQDEGTGFACEQCATVAKSRAGLLQHTRHKHGKATLPTG